VGHHRFPGPVPVHKKDTIVTSRRIKGNNEKNALNANAPAQCAPSIRQKFLRPRQSIAQTRRVSCPGLFELLTDAVGSGRIWLARKASRRFSRISAESAHKIDDEAYHQNQTNPAATDGWTPKVKPTSTE